MLVLVAVVGCGGADRGPSADAAGPIDGSGDPGSPAVSPDPRGGDASDGPGAATPDPTATPVPTASPVPTATPVPSASPVPTATPDPVAAVHEEVVAAWRRYLALSIAARGADPGAEALAFDTYVASEARTALERSIADGLARGEYLSGTVTSTDPSVRIREDGAAIVTDCVMVDLQTRATGQEGVARSEQRRRLARARLQMVDGRWIAFAVEADQACTDE